MLSRTGKYKFSPQNIDEELTGSLISSKGQHSQEYVWISYSDGLNFALLLFSLCSSFTQFTGFIDRGRSLHVACSLILQLRVIWGMGDIYPFQKSLSHGISTQDDEAAWSQSHAWMPCWMTAGMLSTVHGSSLTPTGLGACSEPHA